ncbi:MAG: hypothetical protein GF341_01890, partial [candidate division Zixibacteria bacterium]|nr:hypothetical protein [candidate division Zixibacteria bacterium]
MMRSITAHITLLPKVLATVAMLCLALVPVTVTAQGTIFGTVSNSDLTHPEAGKLTWFGFLDDTDEEIRTELNVGGGYDGLNWFDNFQNYTTEAAGNPFDFIYVNTSRGESFHLSGTIPPNSFQEENVVLDAGSVPATPSDLSAEVVSGSDVTLTWTAAPGLTYHVYRRDAPNNGLYRRIDDPTGNIANPGVAGPSFTDTTSDGTSEYVYLLIAEDESGNYSAHSAPLTVDASGTVCECAAQGDIDGDGQYTSVDMNEMISIIFFNVPDVQDSACPTSRSDLDCDGIADSVDL